MSSPGERSISTFPKAPPASLHWALLGIASWGGPRPYPRSGGTEADFGQGCQAPLLTQPESALVPTGTSEHLILLPCRPLVCGRDRKTLGVRSWGKCAPGCLCSGPLSRDVLSHLFQWCRERCQSPSLPLADHSDSDSEEQHSPQRRVLAVLPFIPQASRVTRDVLRVAERLPRPESRKPQREVIPANGHQVRITY